MLGKTELNKLLLVKLVVFVIFVFSVVYCSQCVVKNYYGTKLSVLCMSLERILKNPFVRQKDLIIQNALPVINFYKNKFLDYPGYWLDIYNVYNQAAVVENLNGDKKTAFRMLLVSSKYHPYLAETYRAMSSYLKDVGQTEASEICSRFYRQLLSRGPVNLHLKQKCLDVVQRMVM